MCDKLSKTRKGKVQGSGLGMLLCVVLVNRNGCQILVKSEEGKWGNALYHVAPAIIYRLINLSVATSLPLISCMI